MSCVRFLHEQTFLQESECKSWVKRWSQETLLEETKLSQGRKRSWLHVHQLSRLLLWTTGTYSRSGLLAYPVEHVSKIVYQKVRKSRVFIQHLNPLLSEDCFGDIHLFQMFNWTLSKVVGSRWELYVPKKAKMGCMNLPATELAINEHSHTESFNLYLGIWWILILLFYKYSKILSGIL